jgi:heme exporter protein B
MRLFACFLRWDLLREVRRKDTVANMALFGLLVVFLSRMGVDPDPKVSDSVGPVFFWVAILFAGTVGLSQIFAAEREGSALSGILLAPVDLGVYYLAKVAASWIYVMAMELVLLSLYCVLFGFAPGRQVGYLLGAMGTFTLGYLACGVVLAAMTSALRTGGEVILRILLVPLMIPFVWIVLRVSSTLFSTDIAGGTLGGALRLHHFFVVGTALDLIYLTAGYLLFPKVLEE